MNRRALLTGLLATMLLAPAARATENPSECTERIKKIISEELAVDLDKVTLQARVREDLANGDPDNISLLATALEIEFGVRIADDELENFTVQEIVDYLEAEGGCH